MRSAEEWQERLEKEFYYVPTDLGQIESIEYRLSRIEKVLIHLLSDSTHEELKQLGLCMYAPSIYSPRYQEP